MSWAETLAEFRAAEQWLFSLVTDPQGQRYFRQKSADQRQREWQVQMARTADFLAFVGHPERAFRSIHVAGTSGKGSVTMMTAALLQALGLPTAHHTSPYLQSPTEKLVRNGQWIRPSDFSQYVGQLRQQHERWAALGGPFTRLKYGEAWVALTFLWLAQAQVAWGVVETGMGGRFDPTNLLPSELAIITNVGWDHEQSLGPTLRDIAGHKAGIIKPQKPVITAVTDPDLLAVIEREAAAQQAPLWVLGRDFTYTAHGPHMLTVQTPHRQYAQIEIGQKGLYQLTNAAVAIAAVDWLAHRHGYDFTAERIRTALAAWPCPGRFEVMQDEPLVILDGAHNPHKMAALAQAVRQLYPRRRLTVILGALVNKKTATMLAPLLPLAAQVIATRPFVPGKPALPPATLAEQVQQLVDVPVVTAEDVRQALALALDSASANDLILVTGSLYLVGEARSYWYPTEQLLYASEYR